MLRTDLPTSYSNLAKVGVEGSNPFARSIHQRNRRPVARCVARPAAIGPKPRSDSPCARVIRGIDRKFAEAVNLAESLKRTAFPGWQARPRHLALSEMTRYLLKAVESFVATL